MHRLPAINAESAENEREHRERPSRVEGSEGSGSGRIVIENPFRSFSALSAFTLVRAR